MIKTGLHAKGKKVPTSRNQNNHLLLPGGTSLTNAGTEQIGFDDVETRRRAFIGGVLDEDVLLRDLRNRAGDDQRTPYDDVDSENV